MHEMRKLASGREVSVRPLSWEEFWESGRIRLEAAKEGLPPAELLEISRQSREQTLSACVYDWERLRHEISLPEALELERIIEDISKAPVLEGNS